MASSLAYRSNIRVNTISKSVASLGDGITRAQKSANKINSSLLTKNRESQKNLSRDRISFMKRREAVRRREQEDLVEASGVGGAIKRQGKVITSSTKGFLGRILDFIGTLMVGWLVQNLPSIIRMAEELISRIQKLTSALGGFVGGVQQILSGFGSALSGSLGALVRFDFAAIEVQMSTSMKQIEQGFMEMENSIDYAMNILSQPFNFGVEEGEGEGDVEGEREYTPGASQSGGGGSWKPVLDIIGQAESRANGYNAIAPGDYNPRLSQMTIAEANRSVGVNGGKGAIGRYQLTNPIGQAAKAGLKPTDIFSPENQDKIAIALIEGRGVTLEMIRTNPTLAGNLLSGEWAGLPVLSNFAGKRRGQSYYEGYKGNAATVTPEQVEAAFKQVGKPETTNRSGSSQPSGPTKIDKSKRYKVGENIQGVGTVSSLFGPRVHPITGQYRNHGGLDISMNTGMYISCTLPCRVVEARSESGYGKYTDIIIPSLNIRLRFAHLSSQLITNGEVKPGQPFARSGNSGSMTTGPHVHLEATTNMGGTAYGGDVSPDPYVSVLMFTPKPQTGFVASTATTTSKVSPAKISSAPGTSTSQQQYTPERKGATVVLPPTPAPSMPASRPASSGGGSALPAKTDDQNSLNRLMIQRMLLDLAYT